MIIEKLNFFYKYKDIDNNKIYKMNRIYNILNNCNKFKHNDKIKNIFLNNKNENNKIYNYNYLCGGLCGIILIKIHDKLKKRENDVNKKYPTNFIIETLRNDEPIKYLGGFIIGGLIYPISYSLISACLFFEMIKIII